VADGNGEGEIVASYVTDGSEQFLYAVARLVLGPDGSRAELAAERHVYRWFFHRDGPRVEIRLVRADDDQATDSSGAVHWSARHTVTALERSAVRAFGRITHELGAAAHESQWGRPFPRAELKAQLTAMRANLHGAAGS
jgi:hypothetical protein